MPDPVTNIFQTTLLVLYFITPAETVQLKPSLKAKQDFETTKIWTLQSTSQIATENPNMCVANGKLLLQKFEQVSTVTVRLYCLCPEHVASGDVCDKVQKENAKLFESKRQTPPPPAAIIEIGPNTPMPVSSGSSTQ